VPKIKVAELPRDIESLRLDEDLETVIRSNATSDPLLGKDQPCNGMAEKSADTAAAMSSFEGPQLQERLHHCFGNMLFQLEKRLGHE
jgi:hypothetical protein